MTSHEEDTVQFGKVPYAMAAAGRYRGLTLAEWAVLFMITAHNNTNFEARPSRARIAELTGLTKRSVRRSITGLERRGLLTTAGRTGGRGLSTVYRLTTDPAEKGDHGVPLYAPKGDPEGLLSHAKGGPGSPERGTARSEKGDPGGPPTALKSGEQQQQTAKPAPAVAGSGEDQENNNGQNGNGGCDGKNHNDQETTDPAVTERYEALKQVGIGEPVRSRLSERPLAPATIRDKAASCREHGKGTGILVRDLEALADQVEAKAQQALDFHVRQEQARQREEETKAPRREAWWTIQRALKPDGDARAVWYCRFRPFHHRTELEFVRSFTAHSDMSDGAYATACEEIAEAERVNPDAAKLLKRAEIEAEQPSLRLAEDGVA